MVEHERTGWVDAITWRFSRIAMIIPGVIVAIMTYEVVMRYLFVKPTLWVNELSLWLAGMVYIFAGIYAMQQRSHIRIFIIYDGAPRWLRHCFDVISTACLLAFVFCTVWGGFGEAYAKMMRWERFGTAWDPPIPATMKPLILTCLVIVAVQAVSNLIADWDKDPVVYDASDDLDPEIEEIKAAQAIKD